MTLEQALSRLAWWAYTLDGLQDEPEYLLEMLDWLMDAEHDDGEPDHQTRAEAFLLRLALVNPVAVIHEG